MIQNRVSFDWYGRVKIQRVMMMMISIYPSISDQRKRELAYDNPFE